MNLTVSDVNELKKLIDKLVEEVQDINKKISKIISFIDDFEIFSENLLYLMTILLDERVKKFREELRKEIYQK